MNVREGLFCVMLLGGMNVRAQQYAGLSGLLHTPSADMRGDATLRIGCTYVSENFVPDYRGIVQDIPVYHFSVTPYPFVEASYIVNGWRNEEEGTAIPDRNVCVKVRAVKEDRWWPSVAVGGFDAFGSSDNTYYYAALTKHVALGRGLVGVHAAYRQYRSKCTTVVEKWNGVVGGVTFEPGVYGDLRFTVEYTGNEVNAGFDVDVYRGVRLQGMVSLDGWFCGGVCWEIRNL